MIACFDNPEGCQILYQFFTAFSVAGIVAYGKSGDH